MDEREDLSGGREGSPNAGEIGSVAAALQGFAADALRNLGKVGRFVGPSVNEDGLLGGRISFPGLFDVGIYTDGEAKDSTLTLVPVPGGYSLFEVSIESDRATTTEVVETHNYIYRSSEEVIAWRSMVLARVSRPSSSPISVRLR